MVVTLGYFKHESSHLKHPFLVNIDKNSNVYYDMVFVGFYDRPEVWTSLNDIEEEGKYMPWSGELSPQMWTNWVRNEPSGGRDENCVVAYGDDFRWHDFPCHTKHLPLCGYIG